MTLQYRKRLPLIATRIAGVPVKVWANLRLGIPSISAQIGRATFNTRRGLSSIRLAKGLTWQDRDPR